MKRRINITLPESLRDQLKREGVSVSKFLSDAARERLLRDEPKKFGFDMSQEVPK